MIFVSSFRPFDICTPAIIKNQVLANRSWLPKIEKIFYFNNREPRMADIKVAFLPCNTKPLIKTMAGFCSQLAGWSAIINADIQVGLKFSFVESKLNHQRAMCAISRRWNIATEEKTKINRFAKAKISDGCLDFFAATPVVWKAVAAAIPDSFTMGKSVWDTWLLNFFVGEFKLDCYDISSTKCLFHIKHHSNKETLLNPPKDNLYLQKSRWPLKSID